MITNCKARVIFNSSGEKTSEVVFIINKIKTILGSSPTGSTKGMFEIKQNCSLSDDVKYFNDFCSNFFIGKTFKDIFEFDNYIKTNKSFEKLGGNLITSLSYAGLKICAYEKRITVESYLSNFNYKMNNKKTKLIFNIIDGHKSEQSRLSGIEILLVPKIDINNFENICNVSYISKKIKQALWKNSYICDSGPQGALTPNFNTLENAISFVEKILHEITTFDVINTYSIGLDMAMSDRHVNQNGENVYYCDFIEKDLYLSTQELQNYYNTLIEQHDITYLEDAFSDTDLEGWNHLLKKCNKNIIISGDDLTATNIERVTLCSQKGYINAVVIKPDQVGFISDCLKTIAYCEEQNIKMIASQRTSETEEIIVAQITKSLKLDYIKVGGVYKGDRISKCNYFIRSEE